MSENNEKDLTLDEEVETTESNESVEDTPSMSEAMDVITEINVGDTVVEGNFNHR